jgi:FkbM family methyltransferase
MKLEEILGLTGKLHVADIGAAAIAEPPPYRGLIERGLARLSAFDADPRHRAALLELYGDAATIYTEVIADGERHTIYLTAAETGMSSLLKPSPRRLRFFNGFEAFGAVEGEMPVSTKRLDEIDALAPIDFLKMDIQGGELTALRHGPRVLKNCVAIQLEVSFVALYEDQPTFGEVDVWMRNNGFAPHCFVDLKKWSIAPTIRRGEFRHPFNQILEADILYMRDPLYLSSLSEEQVVHMALIAHYAYGSTDLVVFLMLELERRKTIEPGTAVQFADEVARNV